MATKTERLEARVSTQQRDRIERAALAKGVSVSAFVVDAADERAVDILAEVFTTLVPADYFDDLLAELDRAEDAPQLTLAAKKTQEQRRIKSR